jgi:hypothetical protein
MQGPLTVHLELCLENNQHNALINFAIFSLPVSGSHTAHHQEDTCTMWQLVLLCLNVECLWARMERNCGSILAHGQSTFKETITNCHIVQVAS